MSNARAATRRPLTAAAVTTVLAVTLGGLATAPATATPTAAPTATPTAVPAAASTEQAPLPLAPDARLAAAGATGFLTRSASDDKPELRWTRYADGSSTVLSTESNHHVDGTGSDVVVLGDARDPRDFRVVKLHDMARPAGTAPVEIDLRPLDASYVKAVSPTAVLARVTHGDGTSELHLVTKAGGTVTDAKIGGLPADARDFSADGPVVDGSVLVGYFVGLAPSEKGARAVVDLGAGAVVETYEAGGRDRVGIDSATALSATHVAWVERTANEIVIVTFERSTKKERRIVRPFVHIEMNLVGGWVTYATPTFNDERWQEPLQTFTAVDLATGGEVELLDHMNASLPGPDGTVLVRGGSVAGGEGLYRVAGGNGGNGTTPTTELVASTGEPTALTYLGAQVPAVVDLDRGATLKWRMSRVNAKISLRVTHKATGHTFSETMYPDPESSGRWWYDEQTFGTFWDGDFTDGSSAGQAAFDGEYTWQIRAVPRNGIGPAVEASGSFTAVRRTAPHDYTDNGTPDLLARDASGHLWRVDTNFDRYKNRFTPTYWRDSVGGGWNIYDRIESVGDVAGTDVADTVARDRDGVLWLYQGTGKESPEFLNRVRIGAGWNTYTELAGGSDLTGDGRADLVATDKAGDLYLYKGTGNAAAPFAPRKKIGWGWGIYNQLTATGNIAGAPAGDLVARDRDGVLWLYLGKGDGTFAARTRIGAGWGPYSHLVGIGDGNKDGRPDLYAFGPANTSYFYSGTGDWRAPFATRTPSEVLLNSEGPSYNHVS